MTTLQNAVACALCAVACAARPGLDDLGVEDAPVPTSSAGGPSAPDQRIPGAEGKPSAPFGDFDYARFAGYHLAPSESLDFQMYSAAPSSLSWSPDYAALEALAAHHGITARWCTLDSFVTATGADCCAANTLFDHSLGFAGSGPIVSCGQVPSSWMVGAALASVGLRGLHVARPLTAKELRFEIANGRPVLVRSEGGTLGNGALLLVAGWSPIDSGGDRFLLVREGLNFQWTQYVDLIEGRTDWLKTWTDSWFKISPRIDGCVPSFDSKCATRSAALPSPSSGLRVRAAAPTRGAE